MSTRFSELDRRQLSRDKKELDSRSFGDSIGGKKKKDLASMGIYKLPGTNYWVIDAPKFQDWFNLWIGATDE